MWLSRREVLSIMNQVAVVDSRIDRANQVTQTALERIDELESILVNLREGMLSLKARLDDLAENNMMLENELRQYKVARSNGDMIADITSVETACSRLALRIEALENNKKEGK